MDQKSNSTSVIVIVVSLIACLCVCSLALAGGAFALVPLTRFTNDFVTEIGPILTEVSITEAPTSAPQVNLTPIPTTPPGTASTLEVLSGEEIPESDLRELAER